MKTTFYFISTCFIATGFYMAAINSKNAVPGILVAFGLWALFFWGCDRRREKEAKKRERERLLAEYFRRLYDDRRQ
ncbi:hypothetical protein [Mucilaginibacter sp. UYCu711]|uniref:hypothetical protein n=1 Tax=Mucilaginibacter sp. UYCu711 TaxID=3156339 RepID=UPI003D1AD38C